MYSGPSLIWTGCLNYLNWVMTVQLECFVGSVHFTIGEFCICFNYPLTEHTHGRVPIISDKQGPTVPVHVLLIERSWGSRSYKLHTIYACTWFERTIKCAFAIT